MIDNYKLTYILIKFESTIDRFIRDNNVNSGVAKEVKELIHEKLNILNKKKISLGG